MGSKNFGEAGRYYHIFTKDLGMIYASAQGVRKMASKLRFILQDFNYVKIDLVRGKDFWRVTSASKTNLLENLPKRPETLEIFANISRLLKRLLAGEEANEALFMDLISGLSVLEKVETESELRDIEAITVLRILGNLGYIGGNKSIAGLIKSPFENMSMLEISKSRKVILQQINKALQETHL